MDTPEKILREFAEQMARQSGDVYFKKLAKAALNKAAQASLATPQPQTAIAWMVELTDRTKHVYFSKQEATYFSHLGGYKITPLCALIEPLSVTDSVAVQEPLVTVIGSAPDITMSYMLDRALPVGTKLYAAPTLDKE